MEDRWAAWEAVTEAKWEEWEMEWVEATWAAWVEATEVIWEEATEATWAEATWAEVMEDTKTIRTTRQLCNIKLLSP